MDSDDRKLFYLAGAIAAVFLAVMFLWDVGSAIVEVGWEYVPMDRQVYAACALVIAAAIVLHFTETMRRC